MDSKMTEKLTCEELAQKIKELERENAELKEALKARQFSEEKYRAFFLNSIDACLITVPGGQIIEANAAACALFGYSEEELVALGRDAIIEPTDSRLPLALEERARTGKFKGELFFRRKDGSRLPVEITSALFTNGDGHVKSSMIIRDLTGRKLAEEALAHSEDLMRYIIEHVGSAVAVLDRDLRYIFVSHRFLADYRIEKTDLIGRRHYELFPEISEEMRLVHQKALKGEILRCDKAPFYRADGRVDWVRWECRPWFQRDGSIGGIILYTEVITESVLANEQIRASERKLSTLIDGLPDIIARFDGNGRLLFLSNNAEKVLQINAREVLGKTSLELGFPVATGMFIDESVKRVFASGANFETELTIDSRSGVILYDWRLFPERDAGGIVCSVLSIGRDITSLRKIEQNYQTLFSEMLDGFALHEIILDEHGKPADYRFLAVNPAFERMTGLKNDQVLGRRVLEVLPGTEPFWIETYGKVALTGEPAFFEYLAGEFGKYFEVTAFRTAPNQFACIFSDISGRRRAEQEREKLQAQLLQAQKMESIGRLAGGVAHDFNNMLCVILGHAEMALAKLDPDNSLYDSLEEIFAAARRSADLTRQLLAFARRQTISPRALDLNDAVEGMLKMLRRIIGEDIDLLWYPGSGSCRVEMDASQLDQLLANLCVNARDAIRGQGKIIIETGHKVISEEDCAEHAGLSAGEHVFLAVSDDGCGMSPEVQAHLFEPFFTTKQIGEGTGLGLATVYGIVKQNNGFINVYSEPGKGSTFRIYLPVSTVGPETLEHAVLAEMELRGSETILVVEDEQSILGTTRMMLEQLGYTVLAANSPDEALSIAAEHDGVFHLIITDVIMPGMNGRELAERFKVLYPDLKVLFMSGYTADVIANRGILDKDVFFIAKPFSRRDLADKVREVLNG